MQAFETGQPTEHSEAHLPGIPKLSSLKELLNPPEHMGEDTKELLNAAAQEIETLLQRPLTRTHTTLTQPNTLLREEQLRDFRNEYYQGLQALTCLNQVCESIQRGEIIIDPETTQLDAAGGVRLRINPPRSTDAFGRIEEQIIDGVELVIRTGSQKETAQKRETPMQINFRFLEQDREVKSLRFDMHWGRGGQDRVQVDACLGGPRIEIKHQDVETLNKTGNPRQSLRTVQQCLICNILRQVSTESVSTEVIEEMRQEENLSIQTEALNEALKTKIEPPAVEILSKAIDPKVNGYVTEQRRAIREWLTGKDAGDPNQLNTLKELVTYFGKELPAAPETKEISKAVEQLVETPNGNHDTILEQLGKLNSLRVFIGLGGDF